MNNIIGEAIKDGWSICDKDVSMSSFDFYDTGFLNGVAYLRSLPLAQRLTAEEKERVRAMYSDAQSWLDEKTSFDNPNEQLRLCAVAIQDRLERIFGKDFFKEEE